MSDALRFPFNPIQPGGYSATDLSALDAAQSNHGPVVAVVGATKAGKPNTALTINDPGALRSRLRGGDAYDTARLALRAGGQPVVVVRAGAPTQGAITLAAASGSAITLTSIEYGAIAANIKVAVAAANKITVTFVDPDSGQVYTETSAIGTGATGQKIIDTINGALLGIAPSAFVTATAATPGAVTALTVAASTALSGASDGSSLVAGDFTTALQVLETVPVSIVIAATADATVHAQVRAHCDAMSTTSARMERTMLFGPDVGESVSQVIARESALQSDRAQIVYPGIKLFDTSGTLKTYPSYITAGHVAGRHVAQPDEATSLVHDLVDCVDVEVALSPIGGGDIDQLLAAGVTPIARARGVNGFWIVDSLSTSTNAYFRDFHKRRTADAVARGLREALEAEFVGGKTLTATAGQIRVFANKHLDGDVTRELLWAHQPVQAERSQSNPQTYLVTAPVLLPETTKFIELVVALQPPSTAGAASSIPDNALA